MQIVNLLLFAFTDTTTCGVGLRLILRLIPIKNFLKEITRVAVNIKEFNIMLNDDLDTIIYLMRKILLKFDEDTKCYRPICKTTKKECYNTLGAIQELLGTNRVRLKF